MGWDGRGGGEATGGDENHAVPALRWTLLYARPHMGNVPQRARGREGGRGVCPPNSYCSEHVPENELPPCSRSVFSSPFAGHAGARPFALGGSASGEAAGQLSVEQPQPGVWWAGEQTDSVEAHAMHTMHQLSVYDTPRSPCLSFPHSKMGIIVSPLGLFRDWRECT